MKNTLNTSLPTIKFIATGGTIAMKKHPTSDAPVPAVNGEDLLAAAPEIKQWASIEVDNFSNLPSSYIDANDWLKLAQNVENALSQATVFGVVISHGTDTLEETAYFLDLTLNSHKPVVLVGAQRNASENDYDGPRNLLSAVRVAASPDAIDKGVMIVMNHQINAARDATKSHTSDVESFKSGDYGLLGNVDYDRVVFHRSPVRRLKIPLIQTSLAAIEIIPMFAGATGSLLDAAIANGAQGIVIQALGQGHVNESMFKAIESALQQNIPVIISTRVPNGRVLPLYGFIGGGKTLKEAGAVFAGNLSPQKARIVLMLALQTLSDPASLQRLFDNA